MARRWSKREWAFAEQGLLTFGETCRALGGIRRDALQAFTRGGLVDSVSFDYRGHTWHGYRIADVLELRRKMRLSPDIARTSGRHHA